MDGWALTCRVKPGQQAQSSGAISHLKKMERMMSNKALLLTLRHFTKRAYRIRGVGLGRLCEAVRRGTAKNWSGGDIEISDFMGELSFMCDLGEHMGSQIFWRGHYSGAQLEQLQRLLPEGGVFFDVGANQGEFTVFAASLTGPTGRVVSFEPVTEMRRRLEMNTTLNGFTNVEILPVALGKEAGELPIFGPSKAFKDGTDHIGLSTLFPSSARDTPIETVPVKQLDEIVPTLGVERIDLIKLDIEGGEYAALLGGEQTLARFRPALIFELAKETCQAAGHDQIEPLDWLAQRGYRFCIIDSDGSTRAVNANSSMGSFQNILGLCDPQ